MKFLLFVGAVLGWASQGVMAQQYEWTYLFDGQSVEAFRGYKQAGFPEKAWKITPDGELMSIPTTADAVDLITTEKFQDFELEFEWKIGKKRTNSGVFFHVSEKPRVFMNNQNEPNWLNNYQYQIVDHVNYHDKASHRATGSLYDLISPLEETTPNPIGQYNSSKLLVKNKDVEHWLNGKKVVSYTMGSAKVKLLLAYSKYHFNPNFGKSKKGHIMFQHHYGEIVFKMIRIRRL
jgi:Domain of Unknown Function (DUF1080)